MIQFPSRPVMMKILLKIEYVALFLFSIFLFSLLPYTWWWYLVLFLVPDIGAVGYVINPRIGAITYNIFHLLFMGIGLYLFGIYFANTLLELCGVIIIGHVSLDRALGFGLKYPDSFKHTHLGNL